MSQKRKPWTNITYKYTNVKWKAANKNALSYKEKKSSDWIIFISSKQSFNIISVFQFSSVQLFSHVQFFATPWTAECQPSLSITNSQSSLKLMSIESMMPSNHLILCPFLLPPSIFPSIRVFSNESILHIRWPKY